MSRRHVAALSAALLILSMAPAPAVAGPARQSYIVVFKDSVSNPGAVADEQARSNDAQVAHVYRHALKGYAASMSETAANRIRSDSRVSYVELDGPVRASTVQTEAVWGLDRIDQRALPLNGSYTYTPTGTGVTAYIIDTGIRFSHSQFTGRAVSGVDSVDPGTPADDCNGHGTHVAGTVGGATYGVAKNVRLVGVRVLNCNGSGTWSGVIAGIDWVTGDHVGAAPAVANMSLGGGASSAVDTAVQNSIADGVSYAVAAGNGNNAGVAQNACNYSPARVPQALTVGATDKTDTKASWSNDGTCLDVFAPGVGVASSWHTSDTATNTISGTSMATPHVAGAAALYLQDNASASPDQVASALASAATTNVVQKAGAGSPNLLLYTGEAEPPPPPDTTAPVITGGPASTVTESSATVSWNTDEASDSAVAYGTSSGSYPSSAGDASSTTVHSVNLTGLAASTTYYYRVTSTDAAGNSVTSEEATFTTSAPAPTMDQLNVALEKTGVSQRGPWYTVSLQATVTDRSSVGVGGAAVSLHVGSGSCSDMTSAGEGTTNSSGVVTFTYRTRNPGAYCAEANATHASYLPGSNQLNFNV